MSDTAVAYTVGQVYEVDPGSLIVGVNVRADVQESREFEASIKTNGVQEVITVWQDDEGRLVVDRGQRRTLTACKVGTPSGTVPVRVMERPEDAGRIVGQLTENLHRAAMTATEEREAIEQLALLGVSAAQIAKRTAVKRDTVNAALTVAGSQAAKERMDQAGLDLAQAVAVAEFEDDPQAVERIEEAIAYGRDLDHLLQRLRDERADREALAAEAEKYRAQGWPVLDPREAPPTYGLRLDSLVRVEDGQSLPECEWPHVPGAAVVVETDWQKIPTEPGDDEATGQQEGQEVEDQGEQWDDTEDDEGEDGYRWGVVYVPVWICTDPAAAGLCARHEYLRAQRTDQSPTAPEAGQEEAEAAKEAQRAERRRVIDNNKAWRSAETVRRQWLANFVTRKSAPKEAEALICAAVLTGPHWLRQGFESSHQLLREYLRPSGQEAPAWSSEEVAALAEDPATPKAATMRTLAAILTAWEAQTDVHTWRGPSPWDERVMAALTGWGYRPSDVERLLLGQDQETPSGDEPAADQDAA